MSDFQPRHAYRLKRMIQAQRQRTANPFLRQRLEDANSIAVRTDERLSEIEGRLSLLEVGLARLETRLVEIGALVQNDTQAMAAVGLGLQSDLALLVADLAELRLKVGHAANPGEGGYAR